METRHGSHAHGGDVSRAPTIAVDASGNVYVTGTSSADYATIKYRQILHNLIVSCDAGGNERNQFAPGENVYVMASGLESDTAYKIWIQDNPVVEGDPLVIGENPSTETPKLVTTTPDGSLPVTLIWEIPSNAPVTYHEYDIVFDKQDDGDNTGKYNAASDGIDSASVVGFVAPVPELPTIVFLSIGLVALAGWFGVRRRRSMPQA